MEIQARGACTQSTEKEKWGPLQDCMGPGRHGERLGEMERAEEAFLVDPVKGAVPGRGGGRTGQVLARQKEEKYLKNTKDGLGEMPMFAPHECVALKG